MVTAKQQRARALFSKAVKQARGKSQTQRKAIFKSIFGKKQTKTSNQAGFRVIKKSRSGAISPLRTRSRTIRTINTVGGIKLARRRKSTLRRVRSSRRGGSSGSGLMSKPSAIIGAVAVVSVLEQPLRDMAGNVLPNLDAQALGINLVDVGEAVGGYQLFKRGRQPFTKAIGLTFLVLGLSNISKAVLGNVGGLFGGNGNGNGNGGGV